jgi:hypothetical protein
VYQEESPVISLNGLLLSVEIPNSIRDTTINSSYYANSFTMMQFDING